MFDWLISIPGPQFLWIFPVFFVLVTFLVRRLYQLDEINDDAVWVANNLNILEVAYLCGGERRVMELVLFELYREGCLSFNENNKIIIGPPPEVMSPQLLALGKKLYEEAHNAMYFGDLISDDRILRVSDGSLNLTQQTLQNHGLVEDPERISYNLRLYWSGLFIWGIFGGLKLFFGLANHRPSGFLILELVGAFILYRQIAYPERPQRLTALGIQVVAKVREIHDAKRIEFNVTGQVDETQSILLMAAFGITSFSSVPYIFPFTKFLPGFTFNTSSTSGGCGAWSGYGATVGISVSDGNHGGCGGHSGCGGSGCGGGGCSGGGCGGGGCGGCGGCGG